MTARAAAPDQQSWRTVPAALSSLNPLEDRKPMRVLVVEDDREAAAYLTRGLKESGHTTALCR